ncbi:hypothetical protein [Pseudohalioglobus lutimaris]|uniref:Fumarylacetoacetase-like C-terminal domain-containing protein n=1 Tax=Pseudohalioglobus lutimaris TaxID=1737061 RepID=A0A2N5X030_9GAMM|nr:hypothetical protein [Pseudohalioglobus lutimaris]PLW67850.1 hypothetical protein C0039_15680 [Pseudohalioglobus lutimaris]
MHEEFQAKLASDILGHNPLSEFPEGLTLDDAYALLPSVAERVCDKKIRGLKAGLTNTDLQPFFGLDHALLGYVYDWGELMLGDRVPLLAGSQIECELAIILDAEGQPKSVGPAIEFVYVNFSRPEDMTAANLVVSSLGADRFLVGEQIPWSEVDFDALKSSKLTSTLDGSTIMETSPMDSLGGPEQALQWCISEARERGLQIEGGSVLLCGTCGGGLPMLTGCYRVDYGALGSIEFEVTMSGKSH